MKAFLTLLLSRRCHQTTQYHDHCHHRHYLHSLQRQPYLFSPSRLFGSTEMLAEKRPHEEQSTEATTAATAATDAQTPSEEAGQRKKPRLDSGAHGEQQDQPAAGENTDHDGDAEPAASSASAPDASARVPKRKVALLVSFVGSNYSGMQINPPARTIEEELFKALHKAGAVSDANAEDISKIQFHRAARTDKGVSAAGQVVDFKMEMVDNVIHKINAALPADILAHDFCRVTGAFNSKSHCSSRVYCYTLPTYAFAPYKDMSMSYRIDDATLHKARSVFKQFEGTHKFHNYTPSGSFNDRSISRFIISTRITEPVLVSTEEVVSYGTRLRSLHSHSSGEPSSAAAPPARFFPAEVSHIEMVTFVVEGQSFMYNQIRKMVGMGAAVVRGQSEMYSIPNSFLPAKANAPRAPGLGLALDRVKFEGYLQKLKKDSEKAKDNSPPTGSVHFEHCEEAMETFKRENIWKEVLYREVTEGTMWKWLWYLATTRAGVDQRSDEEISALEGRFFELFGVAVRRGKQAEREAADSDRQGIDRHEFSIDSSSDEEGGSGGGSAGRARDAD